MSDKPSLMTPVDAAMALNVPTTRLARWRCKGVGPSYIKLEGRVFYDVDSVIEYINSGRVLTLNKEEA